MRQVVSDYRNTIVTDAFTLTPPGNVFIVLHV